ncbi:sushi, von Willebrand factor type A, EGF and pentraxin domain-containing protein 1-like isoform X2 [Antedon mediterranea]|uniref:sushi, von Willebrand factor type A, EGF and pentraxin domain-containing protein 1-like isoform X2 n=1 Tax=Antedon mediterranea TaxID=105859 RepID=UPI003AF43719
MLYLGSKYRLCQAVCFAILLTFGRCQDQVEENALRLLANLEEFQNAPSEIVFLLDSSGSIGASRWPLEVDFVRQISTIFTVSADTARVAIVSYSSGTQIYTRIDHITEATDKNKCTLLGQLEDALPYTGGGTYTLGALTRADELLANGRPDAPRLVMLLTDGQSNGGSPVAKANEMKAKGITIFSIGLGEGINQVELTGIATSGNVYLLDQLGKISDLSSRLKGDVQDSDSWDYNIDGSVCNAICGAGSDCCDANALCACATNSGSIECACAEGYTGEGTKGQCTKCAIGTYKGSYSNQDCTLCPMHSTTSEGSTSKTDCACVDGYIGDPSADVPCEAIRCEKLVSRTGVDLFPPDCDNVLDTKCSFLCQEGYRQTTGTATEVTCLIDGLWSANPLQCTKITCDALPIPANGVRDCSSTDLEIGTTCQTVCSEGYELNEGDSTRTCTQTQDNTGTWSGVEPQCVARECQPLPVIANVEVSPAECQSSPQKYQFICTYRCRAGYTLNGIDNTICRADESWSGQDQPPQCEDATAPELTNCPDKIDQGNDPGLSSAVVMWVPPLATDNSGLQPVITTSHNPGDAFEIGETTVRYTATDGNNLESQPCTFIVTVKDVEKPTLVSCPEDITESSNEIKTNVFWEDPVFIDNSNKDVILTHLRQSGSEFYWGEKQEIRIEGRDEAGNLEVCTFFVQVRQYSCPFHPSPLNGALACETWLGGQFCTASCQKDFDFSRTPEELYYCSTTGATPAWVLFPSFTRDSTMEFVIPWPDCSVMVPSNANVDLSVQYYADHCASPEGKLEIQNNLISQFQDLNAIFPGLCNDPDTCKVENVNVYCGADSAGAVGSSKRRRRQVVQYVITVNATATVSGSAAQQQKMSGNMPDETEIDVTGALQEYVNTIQKLVTTGNLSIPLDGDILAPETSQDIVMSEITIDCDVGQVLRNLSCVSCPVGTFFDVGSEICEDCPIDMYQDIEAQTTCKVCPNNRYTLTTKTKQLSECREPCEPGTSSSSGLKPCVACMKGFFQPNPRFTMCAGCPDGLTTWNVGTTSALDCTVACQAGHYSRTGYEPCELCPLGEYQSNEGQRSCDSCQQGFTTSAKGAASSSECADIDICLVLSPCKNNATCSDTVDGFQCSCSPGIYGSTCDLNVNECLSNPCMNGGSCLDGTNTYYCVCAVGFVGINCQININDCGPGACLNGGRCIDAVNSFTCQCASGFTGTNCAVNINDCITHNCTNGATCIDEVNSFSCYCTPGYTGPRCEQDKNECDDSPCQNNGTCLNTNGAFTCTCPPGFLGAVCDVNIDECTTQNVVCQNGGVCEDRANAFFCRCVSGFSGTFCETELTSNYDLNFLSASVSNYCRLGGIPDLYEFTITFWMKTADKDNYGCPISYSTRDDMGVVVDNALTLQDYNSFSFYVNGEAAFTYVQANSNSAWHHIALTWESLSGSWFIYMDDVLQKQGTGLQSGHVIKGGGIFVVGQEQDSYGGSFVRNEAFIGTLNQLNIWDYALTANEIHSVYTDCKFSGNVLAWAAVQEGLTGNVQSVAPTTRPAGTCVVPTTGCSDITCQQGTSCLISGIVAKCYCTSGFAGKTCQFDINECDTNNGGCSHTCTNTMGSFTCQCPPGYFLQGLTCKDTSFCEENGIIYRNDQSWRVGCEECTCQGGIITCTPYQCPPISCPVGTIESTCADGCCTCCVADTVPPTITCPANITSKAAVDSTLQVTWQNPQANDNSGTVKTACYPPSGSDLPLQMSKVDCIATDGYGNAASCSFTVYVADIGNPILYCPPSQTFPTNQDEADGLATWQAPLVADNSFEVLTASCDHTSGRSISIGSLKVNCQATDSSGNTGTCSFNVTIIDTQAPDIQCPSDIELNTFPDEQYVTTTWQLPTATDNSELVPVVSCNKQQGSSFDIGLSIVICKAVDAAQNEAECAFNVDVKDKQRPSITCPAEVIMFTEPRMDYGIARWNALSTYDNSQETVKVACDHISGQQFQIGSTTVYCLAEDPSGNTEKCNFDVKVVDNEKPTIMCPASYELNTLPSLSYANAIHNVSKATDNSRIPVTVSCDEPPRLPIGNTNVTCLATDSSGNVQPCYFVITVKDVEPPIINCPPPMRIPTRRGVPWAIPKFSLEGVHDNSGVEPTVDCTPGPLDMFTIGRTETMCEAIDRSGNYAVCKFDIEVFDEEPPVIECPNDITVDAEQNANRGLVSWESPNVSDNSNEEVQSFCNATSPSRFIIGDSVVNCTAIDKYGNRNQCYFNVKVIADVDLLKLCKNRRYGFMFGHPLHCSQFIQCKYYGYHKRRCPNGLHWNENIRRCDWPSIAKCDIISVPVNEDEEKKAEEKRVIDTFCEGKRFGYFPHPFDCAKFVLCHVQGHRRVRTCPKGTKWHAQKTVCDHEHLVDCENRQMSVEETVNTIVEFSCTGRGDGMFADPADPNMWYMCSYGNAYHFICGPGTVWKDDLKVCDWP